MGIPTTASSADVSRGVRPRWCALAAAGVALALVATAVSGQIATRPAGGAGSQPSRPSTSPEGLPGITPDTTSDQMIDSGSNAVAAGRLEDGRKILLAVVARDRTNLRALSTLGYAYERSAEQARGDGTDSKAVAQAERFIDQAVDVYLTAGRVALDQDEHRTAEQMYSRILLHRPVNAKALLGLARIYAATGRRLQAIERYKEYTASQEGKSDPKGYLELGELYLEDTHPRQALEGTYPRQALESTYPRLAMDQLARAQALNPNDPDIDMAFARAYLKDPKGGHMDDAMEAAKAAAKKAPEKAKYSNLLAELNLARGDGEQASIDAMRAIDSTRKALHTLPDDNELLKELSRYYETYEKTLSSLLSEGKANPVVRVDLARAVQEHAVVDRTLALQRALKVLNNAPSESKDDTRLLEELASVQRAMGLHKQARETCRRLLQKDPDNAVAQQILKAPETAPER